MNTVTVGDGATIAVRFDGKEGAPSLVLASSLGTTHAMWDRVIDALASEYRVLRFDMRGHGSSSVPRGFRSASRSSRS
jgi:3-oxoadipate enol-lactonase